MAAPTMAGSDTTSRFAWLFRIISRAFGTQHQLPQRGSIADVLNVDNGGLKYWSHDGKHRARRTAIELGRLRQDTFGRTYEVHLAAVTFGDPSSPDVVRIELRRATNPQLQFSTGASTPQSHTIHMDLLDQGMKV